MNEALLASGLPIEKINAVRKHLSAIKGGRLGALMHRDSTTLVLSDVSRDRWSDVGSGPTFRDETTNGDAATIVESLDDRRFERIVAALRSGDVPETNRDLPKGGRHLLADNRVLMEEAARHASRLGYATRVVEEEQNDDVSNVVRRLMDIATDLDGGTIAIAGGEPTVRVTGEGRGGRCSELAVRFARLLIDRPKIPIVALFSSSDGVDGNSGASGFVVDSDCIEPTLERKAILDDALARSDSASVVESIARVLQAQPTGNNLRDIFCIAKGRNI